MMRDTNNSLLASFAVVGLALAGIADAAMINWGSAQDTTSNAANDIVDGGDVVLALNGHNFGANPGISVTLDGVLFTESNFLGQVFDSGSNLDGGTTGDADYDALLNNASIVSGAAGNPGAANSIYTISGLTDGTAYYIQLWYTEERSVTPGRVMTYGDTEALESTVDVAGEGANGFGQFAIGQFTASGTTQDLSLLTNGFGRSHITAILVRKVPEPGTLSLLGIVGLGAIVYRRFTL